MSLCQSTFECSEDDELSPYRSYTKLKEVDDVLGGAAAWENVDSCDEKVHIHIMLF